MLAHVCVLPITCQMSNKNAKDPYCASARAPSCVASGLLIPLIEYYQPQVDRVVRMTETADFLKIADMIAVLNEPLKIVWFAQECDNVQVSRLPCLRLATRAHC